jgi:cytidine deaminase
VAGDTLSELLSISGPELVIGLVGPVGADLDLVFNSLRKQLTRVGYETMAVRVSGLICNVQTYSHYEQKQFPSDFERIDAFMDAGSDVRRETGRGDALALLTVAEIRRQRTEANRRTHPEWSDEKHSKTHLPRTAYIVRSLKNPAEIQTLRDVYGRAFFVVSAHSPRPTRVTNLAHHICASANGSDAEKYRDKAERLVSRDESEGHKLGQNVRDCFPLADLFVDLGNPTGAADSIARFVEILFGHPFHTPACDEFAMFHAHATALRSSDLSRQVGAAIATVEGQILAVGCNEVPKFGGGHYWPKDQNDSRDYVTGHDSAARSRIDMVSEVFQRLQAAEMLTGDMAAKNAREAATELVSGSRKTVLAGTQILNVIEYGRAVHAETAAITDAARRGVSVQGATLYCTTFPCHLCAKHIIAAGIQRVVYIEPYPKSAAALLFKDSMVVDPDTPVVERVAFQSFVGIAPNVYSFMFRVGDTRKLADGSAVKWDADERQEPRFRRFVPSYMLIEDLVTANQIPATFTGKYAIMGAPDGGSNRGR